MSTSKLALVLAVAIPLTAVADNKTDAQEHMKKAGTAYKEKRWQEAIVRRFPRDTLSAAAARARCWWCCGCP